MQDDLERILIDEETIRRRLDELATQIAHDYRDRELTVIAILNGSVILMADLLRRIPLPLKLDCLSVASYHGGSKTTCELVLGLVLLLPDSSIPADRHDVSRRYRLTTRTRSSDRTISSIRRASSGV